MYDYEVTYMKESEIENAFPYLDQLNNEIKELKELSKEPEKKESFITKIFSKNGLPVKLKRKAISSKNFMKDGYEFRIRLGCMYDENTGIPHYFEFTVNIKYYDEKRNNEFYKRFDDLADAKKYYENMEGVFKNLKRRDLMERLFKSKIEEINNLKNLS